MTQLAIKREDLDLLDDITGCRPRRYSVAGRRNCCRCALTPGLCPIGPSRAWPLALQRVLQTALSTRPRLLAEAKCRVRRPGAYRRAVLR